MTTLGLFFPEEGEGVNHHVPQKTELVICKVVEHDLDISKQAVLELPYDEPRPFQRIPHGLESK